MRWFTNNYGLAKLSRTLDHPSLKLDRSITPVVSRISISCSHNNHRYLCNDSHCICECHNAIEKERLYVKKSIGIYTLNLPLIVTDDLNIDAVKWTHCYKCNAMAGEFCKTPQNIPARKIHSSRFEVYKAAYPDRKYIPIGKEDYCI